MSNLADPPPCCVCGDWQVPRRVVVWGEEGETVAIAAVCKDAQWCQARAAGGKLDGLPLEVRE